MFSNKHLRWKSLFLALQFFVITACSNFLNEKSQDPQTFEVSNDRFACLQSLPKEINKFLAGEVSAADIRKGFDCGTNALLYFKNKTKGSFDDTYTLEDMRNFFGKYFLKQNNVTPAFAGELFKLKKMAVGGSDRTITKNEIQKLVDLLEVVKEQAVYLAPHVVTLLGQNSEPTWHEVDAAADQLGTSLWALFKEIDLTSSTYTFKDLQQFMDGLDEFINAKQFYLSEKLGSNVVLLEAIKNVLMGEKSRFDSMKDWESAVKTCVSLYKEALRYKYFLAGHELDTQPRLLALMLIVDDAFQILENTLPMQRHGAISFTSIDTLLDRLAERNFLPLGLSSKSLKDIYKKIILRLLDPRRNGDTRGMQSLERTHLLALKQEWMTFRLHQRFIDLQTEGKPQGISFAGLKEAAQKFNITSAIEAMTPQSLEQEALARSWEEGLALLTKDRPVIFNGEGRLSIVNVPAQLRQTWSSLTKWNVMRAMSRALLVGYGHKHSPSLLQEVITEPQMELWYSDFAQLGIEIKAFDPRSTDAGSRSFKEANFFTFNGNGDSEMSFFETFDFVSFLVAGGVSSAESIRLDVIQKGCALSETDIFGYPWLKEDCFSATLRKNFQSYFNNLPEMATQVAVMNDEQWKEFYGNLMFASRVSPADGGRVETSDLRTAIMILHYTESLVTVYDADNNGRLNLKELQTAAPRFTDFMMPLSPIKIRSLVEDFFVFLVYHGKKPDLSYFLFPDQKAYGKLEDVTRTKILRVFKVLKDEAAKK